MPKTKAIERLVLNAAQKNCLEFYANGDFEHLAKIESKDAFEFELSECGDGLLRFLITELASSEDCESKETALSRLENAIEDIQAVERNVSMIPDDAPWEPQPAGQESVG